MLGRNVVLGVSSGCLNTGSCRFHLVAIQKNQGGRVVQGRTIVLCYTGWFLCDWKLVLPSSWCRNTQRVGASFYWVLEKPKSWLCQQVVACTIKVVSSKGVGAHNNDNVQKIKTTYHIKKKRFFPFMGFLRKYLSLYISCV
jgi:hypothetical protein